MASSAFQLGWEAGHQKNVEKRQRKQALSDEERRATVATLYDQGDKLSKLAYSLPEGSADREKAMKQLTDVEQSIQQIYHPDNNPGAIQKDWHLLTSLVTGKKSAPTVAPQGQESTTTTSDMTLPSGTATAPAGRSSDSLATADLSEISLPTGPVTIPGTGSTTKVTTPALATSEAMAIPTPKIKGLVAPGNVPIWNRPTVKNDDGTVSSEFSTSFIDENKNSPYFGKEVLVPTVVDGKFLTPDGKKPPVGSQAEHDMTERARTHYEQTGQHLGVFDSPQSADKYAAQLHSRGERARPDAAAYQTPAQRKQQAQQDAARKKAELAVAAAGEPPTADPKKLLADARAQVAAQRARIDAYMEDWNRNHPDATEEQQNAARQRIFEGVAGFKTTNAKMLWKTGRFGPKGELTTVLVNSADPDAVMQYTDGTPVPPELARTFVEQKGSAKGLTFLKVTGQVKDADTGRVYNRDDANNPPEVEAMFKGYDRTDAIQKAFAIQLAAERGKGYNDSRWVNVLDQQTGQTTSVQYSEFRKDPSRYVIASEYDKWSPRVNMLEDLRGSSRIVRDSIKKLQAEGGFNWQSDAVVALQQALSEEHPQGAIQKLIATNALGTLTPDQQHYLISTAALIEQAMGMRSILGAGAGSDDVRRAITNTIPGLLTPSADFAINQMDVFDGTLERVHRMIPANIKLQYNLGDAEWTVQNKPSPYSEIEQGGGGGAARPATGRGGGGGGGGAATTGGGAPLPDTFRGAKGSRSLQGAIGAMPGKSQAEVIKTLHDNQYSYTLP